MEELRTSLNVLKEEIEILQQFQPHFHPDEFYFHELRNHSMIMSRKNYKITMRKKQNRSTSKWSNVLAIKIINFHPVLRSVLLNWFYSVARRWIIGDLFLIFDSARIMDEWANCPINPWCHLPHKPMVPERYLRNFSMHQVMLMNRMVERYRMILMMKSNELKAHSMTHENVL